MLRVAAIRKAILDKFGAGKHGFGPGDPLTATPPTSPGYEWHDHVQEEIARVIEAAGITLDPTKYDQLLTAIQTMQRGKATVNVAGGAQVVLTAAQYSMPILILTGALTANINLVFPAISGAWIVRNQTTGAFTVTCKTAAGTGVAVSQGCSNALLGDGANIEYVDRNIPRIVAENSGAISTTGVTRILFPAAGTYAISALTGAIKIEFPAASAALNSMVRMRVELWDYGLGESITLLIGGYVQSSLAWSNQSVTIISSRTDRDYNVRFGNNGTVGCIWIGELASTWSHLRVGISELMVTYNTDGSPIDRWSTGWTISGVAAFDTVEDTISGNLPVARTANALATARTITLGGDLSGFAVFDGTGDVLITAQVASIAALFTGANQSLTASGYQKLPGGLIVQWGVATANTGNGVIATFPIAFPNACFFAGVGDVSSPGSAVEYVQVLSKTLTNMSGVTYASVATPSAGSLTFSFFAIGN